MSITVSLVQIMQLAPNCRASYRTAFDAGQVVLERYAIAESPLRVAHFLAQVLHESGALTVYFENLNYSPERLPVVWPTRFRPLGPLDPLVYAHNQRRLGNEVYGGRLGNVALDDGYTYRGRGLLQLTGKDNYRRATSTVRMGDPAAPDFASDPDAVIAPEWCLAVAAAAWHYLGCNAFADKDDVRGVTGQINGGYTGLSQRLEWTRRAKYLWH